MLPDFRSDQINFLADNVELVRSRFVYEKITYQDIAAVHFKKGYLIKNRWIIRLLSIATIIATVVYILYGLNISKGIEQMNSAQWFNKGSLLSVWGPVLLIILAMAAFYQSFLKSMICHLQTTGRSHMVRIRTLEKNQEIGDLIQFLREKEIKVIEERK